MEIMKVAWGYSALTGGLCGLFGLIVVGVGIGDRSDRSVVQLGAGMICVGLALVCSPTAWLLAVPLSACGVGWILWQGIRVLRGED